MIPDREVRLPLEAPYDVRRTLSVLGHGRGDPSYHHADDGSVWRAANTAEGPATVQVWCDGGEVRVRGWGAGASLLADRAADLLGLRDDPTALEARHPVVRELQRRFAGLRLVRGWPIMDLLVPTILGQRVTGAESKRSWRAMVRSLGTDAPGPVELRLPPRPEQLRRLGAYAFHRFGVEAKRAETILRACRVAGRMEEAGELPIEAAVRRLCAIRGIGPWTAAITLAVARGWADAVPLGDYNLPDLVAWVLAGERGADDARMLELLAPFEGQRWRVIRLLKMSGRKPPRRGPRRPIRS